MSPSSSTFRLFVSSTFEDLRLERDAFQRDLYPRIERFCRKRGFAFQAVDLRWGVTTEAGLDQQTMRICLQELRRCQEVSPRPRFLVLLGDRYGWRPLPAEIPAAEFEQIRANFPPSVESLLVWSAEQPEDRRGWYRRDDNARPGGAWILQPRSKGRFADLDIWTREVERPLRAAIDAAMEQIDVAEKARIRLGASATEQEIYYGALEAEPVPEQALAVIREIPGVDPKDLPETFVDRLEDGAVDTRLRAHLEALKARVKDRLGKDSILRFTARLEAGALTSDHIQDLCDELYEKLTALISHEIAALPAPSSLEREIAAHDEHAASLRGVADGCREGLFLGREDELSAIASYLDSDNRSAPDAFASLGRAMGIDEDELAKLFQPRTAGTPDTAAPVLVTGEAGSGKSALLAESTAQARTRLPSATIVARHIGTTPGSTDPDGLFTSLMAEARRATGSKPETDPGDTPARIRNLLKSASAEHPLILFLDSIEHLQISGRYELMDWLVKPLPDHVRVVISCAVEHLTGAFEALSEHLPARNRLQVGALSGEQGERLLEERLARSDRDLQPDQRRAVLAGFDRTGSPGHLDMALALAANWHSYDSPTDLGENVSAAADLYLARIRDPTRHDPVLVDKVLLYLHCSRRGLAEAELLGLLDRDADLWERLSATSHQSLAEAALSDRRLPFVLWSRIRDDLQGFLRLAQDDGAAILGFSMTLLAGAVERHISRHADLGWYHARIADYFQDQPTWIESAKKGAPNLRKLSELPYQLSRIADHEPFLDLLFDFDFARAHIAGHGLDRFLAIFAYQRGAQGDPGPTAGERIRSASYLAAAYRQVAHVIVEDPDQLPGQLLGVLPDDQAPDLAAYRDQLRRHSASAWLYPEIRTHRVEGQLGVLTGHEAPVTAVTVSPDGQNVFSGDASGQVSCWDLATLTTRWTLKAHDDRINVIAVSGDGRTVLTGSGSEHDLSETIQLGPDGELPPDLPHWDYSLRVLRSDYGWQRHCLIGHRAPVRDLLISRDGSIAFSCADDTGILLWDIDVGREIPPSLTGHTEGVISLNLLEMPADSGLPELMMASLSRSEVRFWDLKTRQCIEQRGSAGPSRYRPLRLDRGLRMFVEVMAPDRSYWAVQAAELATQETMILTSHSAPVQALALAGNATRLVTGSADKTVAFVDLERGRTVATWFGHLEPVNCVALERECRFAVSGSDDRNLILWDASLAEERAEPILECHHTVELPGGPVQALTMDRSGERLLTALADGDLVLWNCQEAAEITRLPGVALTAGAVALSGDAARAVVAVERQLRCLDLTTGAELWRSEDHDVGPTELFLTEDGRFCISGGADGVIFVHDGTSGRLVHRVAEHDGAIQILAQPAPGLVLSGSADQSIRMWNPETGACRATLHLKDPDLPAGPRWHRILTFLAGQARIVLAMETGRRDRVDLKIFDPFGTGQLKPLDWNAPHVRALCQAGSRHLILSVNADDEVSAWRLDRTTGRTEGTSVIVDSRPCEDCITELVGSPSGPEVVLATKSGQLRFCRVAEQLLDEGPTTGHGDDVNAISITSDGAFAASAGYDRKLYVWDLQGAAPPLILGGHTRSITSVRTIPGTHEAITCAQDGSLRHWDLTTGRVLHTMTGHGREITALAVDDRGDVAASVGFDRKIRLWDIADGAETDCRDAPENPVSALAFLSGKRELVVAADREIRRYDVDEDRWSATVGRHDDAVTCLGVDPMGRWVLAADKSGSLCLWDPSNGSLVRQLPGHRESVLDVAMSADGDLAVSVGFDRVVRVWDLASGKSVARFTTERTLYSCAISPDGSTVVAGAGGQAGDVFRFQLVGAPGGLPR